MLTFIPYEDAEMIVRTRYQRVVADDPAVAHNVFPSTGVALRGWHTSGQLRAVQTRDAIIGLLAVAPGRVGWIDGDVRVIT